MISDAVVWVEVGQRRCPLDEVMVSDRVEIQSTEGPDTNLTIHGRGRGVLRRRITVPGGLVGVGPRGIVYGRNSIVERRVVRHDEMS